MSGEDTLDLNIDTYLEERPSQKECVYLLQIVFQHSTEHNTSPRDWSWIHKASVPVIIIILINGWAGTDRQTDN